MHDSAFGGAVAVFRFIGCRIRLGGGSGGFGCLRFLAGDVAEVCVFVVLLLVFASSSKHKMIRVSCEVKEVALVLLVRSKDGNGTRPCVDQTPCYASSAGPKI